MESKNYFGNYTLTQKSLDKLREIEDLLKVDECSTNHAWDIINPKKENNVRTVETKAVPVLNEVRQDVDDEEARQSVVGSSTQFFFTQRESKESSESVEMLAVTKWLDVAESLLESLGSTSDPQALVHLSNLSDNEAESVIKHLGIKLSTKGIYNLCHSICAMNVDQSMRYIRMICTDLLLQKIINLEEPSRQISTVIPELVEKFPDDVQEFIYTPMLNSEIRDTSVFSAIINSYAPQRKNNLILNFLTEVHELKEWHVSVLSQLINSKITDDAMREKLLDLLLEKASIYSNDKNYGKFILSFIKFNTPFSDEQKRKLYEIVAVNETIFRRVMENLLKNMYLYGGLWHIS